MLDNLVSVIETLRERINRHRQYLGPYERRTRVALIDPLLCALGWNVADPEVVEIEPKTEDGWADYALIGSNNRTVMFVEAKKLSADVNQHTRQAVNYAVGENLERSPKIEFCTVTNGDDWQVYNVMTQMRVAEASVSARDSVKSALQFIALWRPNLKDGSFDRAAEPLLEEEAPPVANRRTTVAEAPSPPDPRSTTFQQMDWKSLTDDFPMRNSPAPMAIRFPSGFEAVGGRWKSPLVEAALWLYRNGRLTEEDCARANFTGRSGKLQFINTTGKRSTGQPFNQQFRVPGSSIFLETSFNAKTLIRLTRALLQNCGVDPAEVFLRFP